MTILAIETSCDDTCAAVLDGEGRLCSNVVSSQEAHDRFGGIVPEIAARHHLQIVDVAVELALERAQVALDDVEQLAVTQGPGLVGALLVGLSAAKALAAARELPLAAVDHLQGHVAANFLELDGPANGSAAQGVDGSTTKRPYQNETLAPENPGLSSPPRLAVRDSEDGPFEPPFVCLIASGGHTLLAHVREHHGFEVLGRTLDDAAGEAFDKGARMLGLGYPGGPALDRLAAQGDPHAFEFPASGSRSRPGRAAARPFGRSLDFSFAGLKTSLLYRVRELGSRHSSEQAANLAASYQRAIVEHLLLRAEQALERTGLHRLAVGGGVAANRELRQRLEQLDACVHIPEPALCTDNAAMIASAARFGPVLRYPHYLALDAYATGEQAP